VPANPYPLFKVVLEEHIAWAQDFMASPNLLTAWINHTVNVAVKLEAWASMTTVRGTAQAINWVAGKSQQFGDYLASNGWVLTGAYFGLEANIGHVIAGLVDLPDTIGGMVANAQLAGQRAASATGSEAIGALAGAGYFVGSFVGVTQITEGIMHQDFATGEHLDNWEAGARFAGGISALAMAGAGAINIMGVDVCLANGCFVAGTQVILGVVEEEAEDGQRLSPINLTADGTLAAHGGTLTTIKRYLTQNIEWLRKDDLVLSRDENDPYGRNVLRRIEEVFVRRVCSLQIITVRSSCGALQTLQTTQAHPVYINSRGWVDAAHVEIDDQIMEPNGTYATVVATRYANYPEGILVYNFRVSGTHTYFVRQQGSTAEPLWVHNVYLITEEGAIASWEGEGGAIKSATTWEQLQDAAGNAVDQVGPGKGAVYGTKVHAAFEAEVKALEDPNLQTEKSYLNGERVKRGTQGSVRVDVVEGPLDNPTAIYDLKTGSAQLTPPRIRQLQAHVPNGERIPIVEVRP
jgi:hypothetical protein